MIDYCYLCGSIINYGFEDIKKVKESLVLIKNPGSNFPQIKICEDCQKRIGIKRKIYED